MPIELYSGWLVKDGGSLGSAKKRFCVLSLTDQPTPPQPPSGTLLSLIYFVDREKTQQKGSFLLDANCNFTKLSSTKFKIAVIGGSRTQGSSVEFEAPTNEDLLLWERALVNFENPLLSAKKTGKDLYVVGSSGYVGLSTVKSLSKYSQTVNIFAGVRDLYSAKNDALRLPGVSLIEADMENKDLLVENLNGADCVFIVSPNDKNRSNLVSNTIDACKEASVGHIVILSIPSVEAAGTVYGNHFRDIEAYAKQSGLPFTIVRLSMFMENILGQVDSMVSRGEFYSPLPSRGACHNSASISDIAECIAMIMVDCTSYAGQTLNLTGNLYCEADYAEAFSKVVGTAVRHVKVPYDETRRFGNTLGMLKWQVDGWLELFKLVESGNSCLNSSQSDMPRILGRELSTPLQVAQTVEGPIQSMLKARATLTEKRRQAEEKLEQETSSKLASLQIEKQEETRAAEQKLALRKKAFLDATPTTITGGSLQNKKMGNESSYKKRFLWLDYDSKSLFWAKKEDRVDSKSIVLDKSVAVNVSKDVISLVRGGEVSVDIKVDNLTSWMTAIKAVMN